MTVEEFKAKYGKAMKGEETVAAALERTAGPAEDQPAPPKARSLGQNAANQMAANRDVAATGASPADSSPVRPPPAPGIPTKDEKTLSTMGLSEPTSLDQQAALTRKWGLPQGPDSSLAKPPAPPPPARVGMGDLKAAEAAGPDPQAMAATAAYSQMGQPAFNASQMIRSGIRNLFSTDAAPVDAQTAMQNIGMR